MSALAADRQFQINGLGTALVISPLASVDIFYSGALVVLDQSTGYAEPATDATTKKFIGVCIEHVDNSAGSAGDKRVPVATGVEITLATSGATRATFEGYKMYAVDDQTVAVAGTTSYDVEVGVCTEFISATEVRVMLNPFGAVGA